MKKWLRKLRQKFLFSKWLKKEELNLLQRGIGVY